MRDSKDFSLTSHRIRKVPADVIGESLAQRGTARKLSPRRVLPFSKTEYRKENQVAVTKSLSPRKSAKLLKKQQAHVSKVERDERGVDAGELAVFAKVYKIKSNEIMEFKRINQNEEWQSIFRDYEETPMEAFIRAINLGANDGAASFKEIVGEITSDPNERYNYLVLIYLEYLYLYLHVVDRYAFKDLGVNDCAKFMSELIPIVFVDATKTYFEGDTSKFARAFDNNFNKAVEQYKDYDDYIAPDGLFSEKGMVPQLRKRISNILNINSESVLELEYLTIDTLVSASTLGFKMMVDFSEWIKGPIMSMGLREYDEINLLNEERQERIKKKSLEYPYAD